MLCWLLLALARADEPRIPRRIWQTWKTHDLTGLTHLGANATAEGMSSASIMLRAAIARIVASRGEVLLKLEQFCLESNVEQFTFDVSHVRVCRRERTSKIY